MRMMETKAHDVDAADSSPAGGPASVLLPAADGYSSYRGFGHGEAGSAARAWTSDQLALLTVKPGPSLDEADQASKRGIEPAGSK